MADKFPSRIGANTRSPNSKTEKENIRIYQQITKIKSRNDGKDISRFKTDDGTIYYGLIKENINRSHDKKRHIFSKTVSLEQINEWKKKEK